MTATFTPPAESSHLSPLLAGSTGVSKTSDDARLRLARMRSVRRRVVWYLSALLAGIGSIGVTLFVKNVTGTGYSVFASIALLSMLFGGFGPVLSAGWIGLIGYILFFALPSDADPGAVRSEHVRLTTAFVMYFLAAVVCGLYRQSRLRNLERLIALEDAATGVREVLDGTTDGLLVTGLDGRFEFANAAAAQMLGYPVAELIGVVGQDLITADNLARQPMRTNDLRAGRTILVERELHRKDGSVINVEVSARLLSDGRLISSVRDISERRVAERALRERDERLEQITSTIPGVVFQYQVNGAGRERFSYVSSVLQQLLGVSVAAVLDDASLVWGQAHADDRAMIRDSLQRSARSLRPWMQEFRMRNSGDRWKWVSGRAVPVRAADGDGVVWNGVLEDVTGRRALEDELRQSQKIESIGRLAGGIAHDFNNLLTAILGHADMLAEDLPPGSTSAESAAQILAAAQTGSALTRQMLGFARRQGTAPIVVAVNDVVGRVSTLVRPMLGDAVVLDTECDPGAGTVRVDPSQLEQVLVNLAVNAKDAMPQGGTLVMRTSRVSEAALDREMHPTLPDDPLVCIEVRDSGLGMSEEVRRRAFEPFFTTKPTGQGTGLGLANSYGIITQAGGTIFLASAPGQGTTVRIFFQSAGDATADADAPAASTPVQGRETVLVVDDEPLARRVTSQALSRHGYHVLEADSADEAMAIAHNTEGSIHLLVTDVVMPRVSGPELAVQLLRDRPSTRVLYVSGYADVASEHVKFNSVSAPLLLKPYDIGELARRVRAVLDEPEVNSRAAGVGSSQ